MKCIYLTLLFTITCIAFSPIHTAFAQETPYVSNEVIVKYKNEQSPEDIQKKVEERETRSDSFLGRLQNLSQDVASNVQGDKKPEEKLQELQKVSTQTGTVTQKEVFTNSSQTENHDLNLDDVKLVKTDGKKPVEQIISEYKALPEVEYVEPNYHLKALDVPNDRYYNLMWGLKKIQMEQAWNITHGSNDLIVAVVDSGIDYNHTDLPKDRIIKGKNTINNTNDPLDDNGHGTHVSGIIGAVTNNSDGISGINWNVRIMSIKVLDETGWGSFEQIVNGIYYAANNGAKVINMSLGGPAGNCPRFSRTMQEAIIYAKNKGITVVVAAGNEDTNADNYTPASCNGVITVGATGTNDERAIYSNYGNIVTIAAPGGNMERCGDESCAIFSTIPGNQFDFMQGTSMASPHVAGVTVLILAKNPNLTPDQIKNILVSSADPITTDKPIGKRLNAYKALIAVDGPPPSTPPSPTLTPTPAVPNGDANGDGKIDRLDFDRWRDEYKQTLTTKTTDFDHNAIIDLRDFNIWNDIFAKQPR